MQNELSLLTHPWTTFYKNCTDRIALKLSVATRNKAFNLHGASPFSGPSDMVLHISGNTLFRAAQFNSIQEIMYRSSNPLIPFAPLIANLGFDGYVCVMNTDWITLSDPFLNYTYYAHFESTPANAVHSPSSSNSTTKTSSPRYLNLYNRVIIRPPRPFNRTDLVVTSCRNFQSVQKSSTSGQ